MRRQEDFTLVMILRCSFLISLLSLIACTRTEVRGLKEFIFLKNFTISSYRLGDLKWILKCRYANINEAESNLTCLGADISVYSQGRLSSQMSSEMAYADFIKRSFYLERNAKVKSYQEDMWLETERIFFDYQTENIFSDTKTVIYKNNLKIICEGFEAKSNLSNIKIKKHLTKISS